MSQHSNQATSGQFFKALFGWLPASAPPKPQPATANGWWHEFASTLFGNPVLRSDGVWIAAFKRRIYYSELQATAPLPEVPKAAKAPTVTSVGEIVDVYRSSPLRDRLEFRSHSAITDEATNGCECVGTRRATRVLIDESSSQIRDQAEALTSAGVGTINSTLSKLHEEELTSTDKPFAESLENFSSLLSEIIDELRTYKSGDMREVLDSARTLGRDVWRFRVAIDNFISDDLRSQSLSKIRLAGIIWSDDTQWPSELESRIRENSDRLFRGVYRVRESVGVS